MELLELSCIAGRRANCYNHFGTLWFRGIYIHVHYDSAIPLLGVPERNERICPHTKKSERIFKTALFILLQTRNNPIIH